jgi:SAM-dependent methyltransferase
MSEGTGFQFTDDAVPRAYEEVLVPRLFEPWALLLLDECNLRPNVIVLDVATGPGTVARIAAKRIGPGGRVVATDFEAVLAGLCANYLYRITGGTFGS